jgi:hypothetical protein
MDLLPKGVTGCPAVSRQSRVVLDRSLVNRGGGRLVELLAHILPPLLAPVRGREDAREHLRSCLRRDHSGCANQHVSNDQNLWMALGGVT